MSDEQPADDSIDDFFIRCGLSPEDRIDCYDFVRRLYPNEEITTASCQGFCSMTVFVGIDTVVQFRPEAYQLDVRIATAARSVYGDMAPEIAYIGNISSSGLHVYRMKRMHGISFKDFRMRDTYLARPNYYRARLCKDFAAFLSTSWHNTSEQHIPLGQVGKSINMRLNSLCSDLPNRFRARAREILAKLSDIESLPWILTHGDIVAANIMVDPSSGSLTGLVDWAEAERLPFGICLYGLEEILGEMTEDGFRYYPDAEHLRATFWLELCNMIPKLQQEHVVESVRLARDLGVLLWHGIAFDNGAINRVVQEDGRNIDEIRRLDAFLDVKSQNADWISKI
jgi:hypothetical protein